MILARKHSAQRSCFAFFFCYDRLAIIPINLNDRIQDYNAKRFVCRRIIHRNTVTKDANHSYDYRWLFIEVSEISKVIINFIFLFVNRIA